MKYQWVGGKRLKSNRERIPVINPATEEVIEHIPRGTAADADQAVQAAREAFQTWRWVPAVEKAAMLMSFDAAKGDFLWQVGFTKLAAGRVNDWPQEGLCSSPLIEGDKLYFTEAEYRKIVQSLP